MFIIYTYIYIYKIMYISIGTYIYNLEWIFTMNHKFGAHQRTRKLPSF